MFYPGQPVYVPSEKRLGIYLGHGTEQRPPHRAYLYVWVCYGENGSESETDVFDVDEVLPLSKPDKKSVTGQTSYMSSFQKDSVSRTLSSEEATSMKGQFLEEFGKLQKARWFKSSYEIDTKPK